MSTAEPSSSPEAAPLSPHRLGSLSERFESGGRGPGAVSTGRGDPGGVSYGLYQLASRTGAVAAFLAAEGARWAGEFGGSAPGTPRFSALWRAVAGLEPAAFAAAQHAFVERTHYRPVVAAVRAETGLDLSARAGALRDVCWSCAVQHKAAARIIAAAVNSAERALPRTDPGFDRTLIEAIYAERGDYVRRLAARLAGPERETLLNVVDRRYPTELAGALAMLGARNA